MNGWMGERKKRQGYKTKESVRKRERKRGREGGLKRGFLLIT